MAIGEAFLSAFLQVLFDRLASNEFVSLLCGRKYDDLLDKLKVTLLTVTTLLNDAEEKQFYNVAVKKWLHMTKDALYDAEDLLDDLASEALACKTAAESPATTKQVRPIWNRISTSLSPSSRGIEHKLVKIIERLELIAQYKNVLGLKDNVLAFRHRSPTTSLVDESCVYGRSCDKEEIIRVSLCDEPTSSKVGVVPIVGMAGIGKTTLAQLIYNDERVDKHFDLKIWMFVSDHFDAVRVTKTILESVNMKNVDLDDLNLLQVCLKEKLAGKRFLIVLDDVWNKRNDDWDLSWIPFRAGRSGSKIIVTTQNSDVASSMGTVPAYHLRGLSFEDSWLLFKSQAFEKRIGCCLSVYPLFSFSDCQISSSYPTDSTISPLSIIWKYRNVTCFKPFWRRSNRRCFKTLNFWDLLSLVVLCKLIIILCSSTQKIHSLQFLTSRYMSLKV